MATCGIHLVWTTYMTWLPGDPRGHWSPLFDFYGRLIAKGRQLRMSDPVTCSVSMAVAKETPKILNAAERDTVAENIGQIARNGVGLHAAAIEPTHVHLLAGPITEDVGRFAGRLKGMTSSAVLGVPGNGRRKRTWTSGYWKVFLYDLESMVAVKSYIDDHNLRRGLPAEPFDWLTPLMME